MMQALIAELTDASNGPLSEATTVAILETYMRLHGPTTGARLDAVVQTAVEAAVALACFQMTMAGEFIPELKNGSVVLRKASAGNSPLESVGDIMRRVDGL